MPKYAKAMVEEDKKWRAQCDAETLATAEKIRGDKERLTAAEEAALEKAKEKQEEAVAMTKVATGVMSYTVMPKEK